jgi:K(+)-stimulated pyrophosphate-energized sodium pump
LQLLWGVAGITGIDIYKANVLACLFVGGMVPFIFSSLAIRAVGEAAMAMVEEVRRQFRTIPGIMEGTGKPEYDKCVAISTQASIKKMMLPGAIAIVSPLIIGFMPGLGAEALGGFLAGATVSGVLMGMFQNNAGGAWDNAKKSFEKGVEINGQVYYKKSEPHKASVTGDTVGDPFKDTSGPSMNILIKLMSIVSLVIAPTLAEMHNGTASTQNNKTKTSIEKKAVFTSVDESAKDNDKVVSAAGENLVNQLASDHLLAKNDYAVSLKNGVLTINGNAQPKEIFEKYQSLINAVNSSEFTMQVKQQ